MVDNRGGFTPSSVGLASNSNVGFQQQPRKVVTQTTTFTYTTTTQKQEEQQQPLVFGQSCSFDTVTPKKVALRAEIFNNELMESLFEPDDEDTSDDEAIIASKIARRTQKVKQLSGNKKRPTFDNNQIAHTQKPEEERKVMRNYLDEETLEDEYKRAMNTYFGKKVDRNG